MVVLSARAGEKRRDERQVGQRPKTPEAVHKRMRIGQANGSVKRGCCCQLSAVSYQLAAISL
jgi:hypothetical protein